MITGIGETAVTLGAAESVWCILAFLFSLLLEFYFVHFRLFLLVVNLSAGFGPFHQLPQFAAVQPDTVFPAFIYDNPALGAEIDPVHQFLAYRAIDIGNREIIVSFCSFEGFQLGVVDVIDVGHRFIQQGFQLPGIEKHAQAMAASFDQEFIPDFQIDGLHGFVAAGAGALGFRFFYGILVNTF